MFFKLPSRGTFRVNGRLLLLAAACCLNGLNPGSSAAAEPGAFSGTIVGKSADKPVLTVKAEAKESNAFDVQVDKGDWVIAKTGRAITGKLSTYDGGWRMEAIWPSDGKALGIIQTLGRRLHQDTDVRGVKAFRSIGEFIPRFALWDQTGELFESTSLRDQPTVINFVFTRCTQPAMCPASTAKMKALQDAAKEAGVKLTLVSITLDPEFDTPGVCQQYLESHGISPENFHFLTGPESIVEDLKTQLGILATPDASLIVKHTLMTIIVDAKGKIIYQVPGSGWSVEDFIGRIKTVVSRQ
ncbi:MAG: SCO family protein [Verrucomicrobiota bacterium]|nr:SCO family protein [Verrucomicrobiota bacterium]